MRVRGAAVIARAVHRAAGFVLLVMLATAVPARPGAAPPDGADADRPAISTGLGHFFGITNLAWSERDGLVLTASADNSVKLWQASSGTLIRSFTLRNPALRGMRNTVNAAAMSDGAMIVATGGSDGLRVWDGRTGALVSTLEPPGYMVETLAMDRAGSLIIAAGNGPAEAGAHLYLTIHRRLSATAWSSQQIALGDIFDIDQIVLREKEGLLAIAGSIGVKSTPGGVETKGFFASWSLDSATPIKPVVLETTGGSPETQIVGFTPSADALYVRERDTVYRVDRLTARPVAVCSGWFATLSPDGKLLAVSPGNSSGDDNPVAAELRDTASGAVVDRIPWPDAASERERSRVAALDIGATGDVIVALNSGKLARWDGSRKAYRWIVQPRTIGPIIPHILDASGYHLVLATDKAVRVVDLTTGAQRVLANPRNRVFDVVVMSRDGRLVAAGGAQAGLHVWSTDSGTLLYDQAIPFGGVTALAFSNDGKTIAIGQRGNKTGLVRARDGQDIIWFGGTTGASALAFLPDDRMLAVGDELGEVHFVPLGGTGRRIAAFPAPGINATVSAIDFAADGRMAVAYANGYNRAIIYNVASRSAVATDQLTGWINALAFDTAGRRVVSVGQDQRATVWDAQTGKALGSAGHSGVVLGLGLSSDGRRLATLADGGVTLWALGATGKLDRIVQLFDLDGANWIAVDEDGRFDTGDPEALAKLAWLMPDDPLRPLAVDTYLRDYFEPRLLARLLACRDAEPLRPGACRDAFPTIRVLRDLNRVAPTIGFASVTTTAEPDVATVELTAAPGEDRSQTNSKFTTGAFDLRLFRDGQLVGRCPVSGSGPVTPDCLHFRVPLAHRPGAVRFTAYAFNEDRVRSPVREFDLTPSPGPARRPPRAYVIAVGVNAYAGGNSNLTYAAKDARDMSRALAGIGGFDTVPVTLVSDGTAADATRAKIAAVFELLAGDNRHRNALAGIANAMRIERATPDDIVIFSFSGHGYTASGASFYLLPADSEPGAAMTPARLATFISSSTLRDWLEPIAAGQITVIIDACHAAASVNQPGFKPGPMGDSGLGQLAYDKGIRLLAATQPEEAAIETNGLRQGLLTFALLQRGLGLDGGPALADADRNGRVTLSEWLRYGERATPALYRDALAGRIRLIRRDAAPDPLFLTNEAERGQTPVLFDFFRGSSDPTLLPTARAQARTARSNILPVAPPLPLPRWASSDISRAGSARRELRTRR